MYLAGLDPMHLHVQHVMACVKDHGMGFLRDHGKVFLKDHGKVSLMDHAMVFGKDHEGESGSHNVVFGYLQ